MTKQNDELRRLTYTVGEAAHLLGLSRASAYECVRTGEIPSVRLQRRLVVPAKALHALLEGTDTHAEA
jgi:excisionase family DNA binding protein